MQSGSGPSPAPAHQPPPGRSSPSSAASPSSSSSAVSAPNHLGLESMQQRQQQQRQLQLAHRKALLAQQQNHHHQQQLSKAETDQSHLPYQAGGTFGVSGAGFLLREENQSKGLGTGQQLQNPIHQAYLQFALQSAQQKSDGNFAMQQQVKTSMVSQSGRDQDMIMNKLKMQELMSQTANKSQMPMFKRTVEQFANAEKQMEQGRTNHDQRNDLKPFPTDAHLASVNMIRPVQSLLPPSNVQNFANNQLEMAQMQAIQAWAKEHNIDLSVPANLNLIAQILPLMQSNGVPAGQKPTETSTMIHQSLPTSKQQAMQSPAGSESSAHGNSTSDLSVGQHMKRRQMLPLCSNSAGDTPSINNSILHMKQQQFAENSQVGQNETVIRLPTVRCSGAQDTHLANSSGSMNHTLEKSNYNSTSMVNKMQTQSFRPLQQANQPIPLLATPSNNITGAHNPTDTGSSQTPKQHFGFTKKQLHVLKAQILAFRRLKRGERSLPPEVLQAISDSASDYQPSHGPSQPENVNHDSTKTAITSNNEHRRIIESNSQTEQSTFATKRHTQMKEEPFYGEEKIAFASQMQVSVDLEKEPAHMGSIGKLEESSSNVKSEQESEKGSQNSSSKGDCHVVKEKVSPADGGSMVPGCVKMPAPTNTTESSRDGVLKKYHGPIFDFSSFTRRPDTLASTATNYSSNLTLAYDVKDLLYEEAKSVLTKNRTENLKKISWLLAFNLERKIIKPDLVVQLQIEEKKLKLFNLQARLRDEIEHQQEEIMAMSDRQYRKFVRQCEQQRVELARQVQQLQRASREKLLKSVFQWRKKLLESHWAIRDARTTRNRGIAKYHERMLREFSKREDEDRNKRMEALKNNDVDRYREMLLEQQTSIQGDAAQRYAVLSSFLTQTEEYLLRLGGKITDAKGNQEVEEAANAAASAARAQGLSSEEIRAAAACAGEEVMIRNRFSEMNAPKDSSVNKYYNLAHAVTERVTRQPSMLRAGTLRDYQLVGLQWMLSLYNNKLNGILADEMGLGKTVQVMALIAYLMEFKGNYGPHLIIVPNAVLVNWKSELLNWLPSISCIFYVGSKEERSKLFSQEVCAVKFNVLVTTYEFIMYDRSKLSKIDWKYIVIDEAQRMKDRESVLARDLDRYRCQRRLLLTGTPLQNDLKELWSLLNLLLPEVFDNCKAFHDWFSKPFQKDGPHNEEDEWLETEKKVIIIHRLHQILEPFMLRRRLEDVEGSLPRKIPIVVRCRMSAIQGAIYDWIKPTGTIRVDPEDEIRRVQKNPLYQVKTYKNLNNKCMELRKVCNHPLLNYPYLSNYSKDFIVRSCGKLWVLDRILIKLHRAGHRVLLFSTMTKLLDILEEYLQWRRLVYRRIDGSTCLEDRELAIVDFNNPDSECFIFLLSIRAAGRGLNLQTADTVVIYDPDPNPQNEEQAVARAHRIGQKREVKVIYMEAVVDKISSYLKEDELRSGIAGDSDDDLAGRDRYMGSIESLIRSNIQQYKLDMADEVINAGRFDQRTTHEERRMTLEMLLHDEERYQENVHDVPSMQEVNRMIARSEEEVVLFDQMDEDLDWTADMIKHSEVPKWLRVSSSELDAVTASLSKKPLKNILSGNVVTEPNALMCDPSSSKMERRRGRPRKNYQVYLELDDEYGEDSDIDSEERNASEEEVEVGGFNDEGFNDEEFIDDDVLRSHKIQVTQGMGHDKRGHVSSQTMVRRSTNTSSGSGRLSQPQTPVLSSQKFGSLSLLEARPGLPLKKMSEELEEGEIAVSGDSHLDLQQSGSQLHDHEDGEEDQQVLQPKIKRKRSIRIHPRYNVEKDDKQSDIAKIAARSSKLLKVGNEYDSPSRTGKLESFSDAGLGKHGTTNSLLKHKHNTPAKKISPMPISDRISYFSGTTEDGNGHSRESWNNKANNSGGSTHMGEKMSDITQRKCKNVISKLQMRIHKDGNQIVPIFYDWWRRKEKPTFAISAASGNVLDLQRIEQRVDNLEYSGVTDFIADVQSMLKSIVQHCNYTYEVKCEADKLQALFFNIMKIAFPDSDFRQARNAVTFSNPRKPATTPAGSSHKLIANKIKRHTLINKLEKSSPPPRTSPHMATPMDDESRTKLTSSKQPKDSRPVSGSWTEKALEPSQYPPHPGDLVICKKKRKERDKSSIKQRIGPASPLNPSRFGPLSPTSSGGMSSGPSSSINRNSTLSIPRNSNSSLQAKHTSSLPHREMQRPNDRNRVSCSIADIQWAKPVKRMRTDSGKRRPSQM
ncbi:ATP-dependent helicase BRM-like isoform X2 [Zingiber officinale]|uniref:ATP-dependent helicase BRM-like isoform X2 n=1 Tax=Zingiber officinale TaxID=94328 RepID=UPI001C4CE7C3|nr:ATP-dependent helicase BRM-like isoform X2 [Zingiber officinale]